MKLGQDFRSGTISRRLRPQEIVRNPENSSQVRESCRKIRAAMLFSMVQTIKID